MPRIVGETYGFAIGQTECDAPHTSAVQKTPQRTFWARVEEALRERRLPTTKAYVASHLHIKPPSINDWNKPGGYPTIENTISLAKHLGVCTEWLLTERGPKRPLPQDAAAQRLWDLWPHLDDVTKGELIGIAGTASGRLRRSDGDVDEDRQRA
jgi:hypothetical protein